MQHADDRNLILFQDGELDPPRQTELRRHLDVCADCRERAESLKQAADEFTALHRSMPLPSPAGARAQLENRISSGLRFGLIPAAAILSAAAVLIFMAGRSQTDLSKPKNTLTPGETRAISINDVCRGETGNRMVPVSLQQKVFNEYGIRNARPSAYEVDYLITPELGGADSIRNLWPQPYSTVWNAHVKDALEDRLHTMVCQGKLDLTTAQRDIATDWIAAYKKYFHTDRPLPNQATPNPS